MRVKPPEESYYRIIKWSRRTSKHLKVEISRFRKGTSHICEPRTKKSKRPNTAKQSLAMVEKDASPCRSWTPQREWQLFTTTVCMARVCTSLSGTIRLIIAPSGISFCSTTSLAALTFANSDRRVNCSSSTRQILDRCLCLHRGSRWRLKMSKLLKRIKIFQTKTYCKILRKNRIVL